MLWEAPTAATHWPQRRCTTQTANPGLPVQVWPLHEPTLEWLLSVTECMLLVDSQVRNLWYEVLAEIQLILYSRQNFPEQHRVLGRVHWRMDHFCTKTRLELPSKLAKWWRPDVRLLGGQLLRLWLVKRVSITAGPHSASPLNLLLVG